jgi:hypothetical protein
VGFGLQGAGRVKDEGEIEREREREREGEPNLQITHVLSKLIKRSI